MCEKRHRLRLRQTLGRVVASKLFAPRVQLEPRAKGMFLRHADARRDEAHGYRRALAQGV
jgi:hypothetical protein